MGESRTQPAGIHLCSRTCEQRIKHAYIQRSLRLRFCVLGPLGGRSQQYRHGHSAWVGHTTQLFPRYVVGPSGHRRHVCRCVGASLSGSGSSSPITFLDGVDCRQQGIEHCAVASNTVRDGCVWEVCDVSRANIGTSLFLPQNNNNNTQQRTNVCIRHPVCHDEVTPQPHTPSPPSTSRLQRTTYPCSAPP